MNNNDVLRRLRYAFDLSDGQMMDVFAHAEHPVTREQVCAWLKSEEDPELQPMNDTLLATFLNGFIASRRGKKEGGLPAPEKRLTNNMIFMKLKIALDLRADDILALFARVPFELSKPELSAFFRRADHKHYRECKDQVLRNFLQSLTLLKEI